MKKTNIVFLTLFLLFTSSSLVWSAYYTKEDDFKCDSSITDCEAVTDELVSMVRNRGYKCDSVSNVLKWAWSRGFTLRCNDYIYAYEIKDVGGRWTVSLE